MRILISGASGFIGSNLVRHHTAVGHSVARLVRQTGSSGGETVSWDPVLGRLNRSNLEGFDGVIHLAGESIGSGRWTREKKKRIVESRENGTRLICENLAGLMRKPRVLISASAIGYYGPRGAEILDEDSLVVNSFLADVCRRWEEAVKPAHDAGIRVVLMRVGVVLHPAGGALSKMLPLFRFGLGGKIGSGEQYLSWIALDDLVGLVDHLLENDKLAGPVNAVAPNPVTNREFTKALSKTLKRPAFLSVPAFALRLLLGEMAEETLLASQRAVPRRAIESGYSFRFPEITKALEHLLLAR